MEYRGEEISENELAQYEEIEPDEQKLFVLYDGRAKHDVDEASVYVAVSSEREAIKYGKEPSWNDGLWYEYDVDNEELINGRPRWDLPPNHIRRGYEKRS